MKGVRMIDSFGEVNTLIHLKSGITFFKVSYDLIYGSNTGIYICLSRLSTHFFHGKQYPVLEFVLYYILTIGRYV